MTTEDNRSAAELLAHHVAATAEPTALAAAVLAWIKPAGSTLEVFDLADAGLAPPRHKTGRATLRDVDSFVNYIEAQGETPTVYAHHEKQRITAVFDDHTADGPGRRQFTAELLLATPTELMALETADGKWYTAADFADLVDDLRHIIATPDTAQILELVRRFRAETVVTLEDRIDDRTGDRTFHYETNTETRSEIAVPDEFGFAVPIFRGQAPAGIRAAFRYRTGDNGVMFGLKLRHLAKQREDQFDSIVGDVLAELGDVDHILQGEWAR